MSLILDCYEDRYCRAVLKSDGVLVVTDKEGNSLPSIPQPVIDHFFEDEKTTRPIDVSLWALQRAADILAIEQFKIQKRICHRRQRETRSKREKYQPSKPKTMRYVGH